MQYFDEDSNLQTRLSDLLNISNGTTSQNWIEKVPSLREEFDDTESSYHDIILQGQQTQSLVVDPVETSKNVTSVRFVTKISRLSPT